MQAIGEPALDPVRGSRVFVTVRGAFDLQVLRDLARVAELVEEVAHPFDHHPIVGGAADQKQRRRDTHSTNVVGEKDRSRRLGFERDGITLGLTKPLIDRQFLVDHGIEYDTSLVVGEDYWLLADCVAAGASFVVVPDALYYYRLHAQQTTKTTAGLDDLRSSQRRLRALLERGLEATDPEAAAKLVKTEGRA